MICTPEADDKESRMNDHSLAKAFKRLYDKEERSNGVKGHSKHKKREDTQILIILNIHNKAKKISIVLKFYPKISE